MGKLPVVLSLGCKFGLTSSLLPFRIPWLSGPIVSTCTTRYHNHSRGADALKNTIPADNRRIEEPCGEEEEI